MSYIFVRLKSDIVHCTVNKTTIRGSKCNGHALLSTLLRFSFPIVINIRIPYAAKHYCLQISYADMLTKVDPLRNELKSLEIEAQASRIKVSKQRLTM